MTGSEAGDERAPTRSRSHADGSQVDVHLDTSFKVLGTEDDGTGEDDEGAEN